MYVITRSIAVSLVFSVLVAIEPDDVVAGQPYVVEAGDSLSSIAYEFYRDQHQWRLIRDANREKVSADGAIVQVGTILDIPDVGGTEPLVNQSEVFRKDPATGRIQVDLVTGNDFKPYADETLPEGGMITEIVVTAFRDLGYEPVVDFLNWPSGYDLTKRGKFAANWAWAPTAEREADFFYSDSLAEDLTFAYWHVDRPQRFEQIDDISGYRVCRAVDYYTEFMDHLIKSGEIEFTQPKDINECWRGLADGSFDFVIQAEFASAAQHAELGLTNEIVRSDAVVSTQSYHAIFPRSISESGKLRDDFNRAIQKMEEEGVLNEIVERHLKAFFANFTAPS